MFENYLFFPEATSAEHCPNLDGGVPIPDKLSAGSAGSNLTRYLSLSDPGT